MRRTYHYFIAGLLLTLPALSASGAAPDDGWRFEIAPYVWAVDLDGRVGAADRTLDVDADFAQIVHDSDSIIGLMLHAEAARGRLAFFTDVTFAKVGVDDIPLPGPIPGHVDTTSTTLWIEGGAAYRFIDDVALGAPDSKTRVSVDALAGARVTVLGFDLDFPTLGRNFDQTNTWVDPFLGARARFDFGRHWAVQLRGDVGGFGAGSQFSWQAVGLVGYRFHLGDVPTTFFAGYRALGQDFVSRGFEWDMVIHGPMIGLSFAF
jgi:hypothetical protein